MASFKIEIHLKWFGFFSFPPGVCCSEIPSNTGSAAPRLALSVFRGTRGPTSSHPFHQRRPGWGPACCALWQRFSFTHPPPFPPPPLAHMCCFSGKTNHPYFSEGLIWRIWKAKFQTAGPHIRSGPPFCSLSLWGRQRGGEGDPRPSPCCSVLPWCCWTSFIFLGLPQNSLFPHL